MGNFGEGRCGSNKGYTMLQALSTPSSFFLFSPLLLGKILHSIIPAFFYFLFGLDPICPSSVTWGIFGPYEVRISLHRKWNFFVSQEVGFLFMTLASKGSSDPIYILSSIDGILRVWEREGEREKKKRNLTSVEKCKPNSLRTPTLYIQSNTINQVDTRHFFIKWFETDKMQKRYRNKAKKFTWYYFIDERFQLPEIN